MNIKKQLDFFCSGRRCFFAECYRRAWAEHNPWLAGLYFNELAYFK